MNAVALRGFDTEIAPESAGRDALLERYRQLRAISRTLHMGAVNATPREAILRMGRRLGVVEGKVFALGSLDELDFVYDLVIYTAPPGETRPVDRYGRKAGFAAGSDEALMLGAMRASRFAFVRVERRHDVAGLILTDLTRHEEIWLMDEGMESSLPVGYPFFARLHAPEAFCMTAGVFVPADDRILSEALDGTTIFSRKTMREAVEDRRFAEAIYRAALRNGICDRIRFQDAPAPAALVDSSTP
jgi:hypothetical protein